MIISFYALALAGNYVFSCADKEWKGIIIIIKIIITIIIIIIIVIIIISIFVIEDDDVKVVEIYFLSLFNYLINLRVMVAYEYIYIYR